MIIDTSNAPCGPGFLPGLRLSERRLSINRRARALRGWGFRRRPARLGLRPPKCRPLGRRGFFRPAPAPVLDLPPPLPRPPLAREGWGAPRLGPHESDAAAGGRHVSALPASAPRAAVEAGALQPGVGERRSGFLEAASGRSFPRDRHHPSDRIGAERDETSGGLFSGPAARPPASLPPSLPPSRLRPQIRRDDPLNLSILLSGGK